MAVRVKSHTREGVKVKAHTRGGGSSSGVAAGATGASSGLSARNQKIMDRVRAAKAVENANATFVGKTRVEPFYKPAGAGATPPPLPSSFVRLPDRLNNWESRVYDHIQHNYSAQANKLSGGALHKFKEEKRTEFHQKVNARPKTKSGGYV